MLVVELRELSLLLQSISLRPDLVSLSQQLADQVENAIWKYGVVNTPDWGDVFAYEVDGKSH